MNPTFTQRPEQPILVPIVIPNGTAISNGIDLKGYTLVSILFPLGWGAGNVTFQVSYDGNTYFNLFGADGTEYIIVTDASQAIIIPPADFAAVLYIKVRSGTSGAPANQTGNQTLNLILMNV